MIGELLTDSARAVTLLALFLSAQFSREPPPEPVIDAQGRIVVYHGVNVSTASKYAPDHLPWHEYENFARLREWGFNLVRFLVFWEAIEPEQGVYDEAYIDAVAERVGWLEELGIDVVLDLHLDLYNRRFGGNGFPDWTVRDDGLPFTRREPWDLNYLEPAVRACYRNFWESNELKTAYAAMLRHLTSRLGGFPNVVGLEIMNEPWPVHGLRFEETVLTPFYEAVEAMMWENGFQTPLYFEPVIYTSAGIPSLLPFQPRGPAVYSACVFRANPATHSD